MILAQDVAAVGSAVGGVVGKGGLDTLHMVLALLVVLGPVAGKFAGAWLVTSGKDYLEAFLKAKKHDELVPVVEALVKGIQQGGHDDTKEAVASIARVNGVDQHDAIKSATQ